MKTQKMKKILPLLLAALFYTGSMSVAMAADEYGETGHAVHATNDYWPEATATEHDSGSPAAEEHGGATAHEEGHGGAGHHAESMLAPKKLKDLLWRAMNFAALVFLLVKFGGRFVVGTLRDRRQEIINELEALKNRRKDAESKCEKLEAELAGMENEIARTVERNLAAAAKEKERILAEAEQAAKEIKRQAEAAVRAAMTAARRSLQEEVAEQATAMAEQLIVKQLTPADHVAIIEQYLDKTGRAVQ